MSSTTAMATASGSYSAGAMIPFTETFVQSSGTTAIAFVGQVLDSGATNFVGYDSGMAEYLLTSSVAGAQQTTLADGSTYYVSSGSAPAGYLATGAGGGAVITSGSMSDISTGASGAAASSSGSGSSAAMTTSRGSSTSRASSSSASAASAMSTSKASGGHFSMGSAVACALGFVALMVGYLA